MLLEVGDQCVNLDFVRNLAPSELKGYTVVHFSDGWTIRLPIGYHECKQLLTNGYLKQARDAEDKFMHDKDGNICFIYVRG